MKRFNNAFLLFLVFILITGCASEPHEKNLDSRAFTQHFDAQRSCRAYIDLLVMPAAQSLSVKRTPEEMRIWLNEHSEISFSDIAAQVQDATKGQGELDPKRESDQVKVAKQLYEVLRRRPDFQFSSCGSDVRDFVMESLYFGLGGEDSPVAFELRRRGIEDGWEQRWVLLVSLMAGALVKEEAKTSEQ